MEDGALKSFSIIKKQHTEEIVQHQEMEEGIYHLSLKQSDRRQIKTGNHHAVRDL